MEYWFRAKRYGWGWYPSSWQGWVVTLVFVLVVYLTRMGLSALDVSPGELEILFFTTMLGHVLVLVGICYWKGERARWRWGGKDMFDEKKSGS